MHLNVIIDGRKEKERRIIDETDLKTSSYMAVVL